MFVGRVGLDVLLLVGCKMAYFSFFLPCKMCLFSRCFACRICVLACYLA